MVGQCHVGLQHSIHVNGGMRHHFKSRNDGHVPHPHFFHVHRLQRDQLRLLHRVSVMLIGPVSCWLQWHQLRLMYQLSVMLIRPVSYWLQWYQLRLMYQLSLMLNRAVHIGLLRHQCGKLLWRARPTVYRG